VQRILLTGGSGQLGHELARVLAPLGEVIAPLRAELDLARADATRSVVRRVAPTVIVNAGAYTAVDRAESDEANARAVNAIAPGVLAEEAERAGAVLVHFSTDYVFDGTVPGPRSETDSPSPLSVYGRTKLEGEEAVRTTASRHLVLRTGWVYGARGHNFLRTMLRLGTSTDELRVVSDQVGSPTWTRHLAMVTGTLLNRLLSSSLRNRGLYHVTSSGECSWSDFATAAVQEWFGASAPAVTPIRTSDWPAAAKRPARSVLCCDALEADAGLRLPHWRDALQHVIEDLRASSDAAAWTRSAAGSPAHA
jgi:dTDP-4-dehydrorhamnose reductase